MMDGTGLSHIHTRLLLVLLLLTTPLWAQQEGFLGADRAFNKGDFRQAEALYNGMAEQAKKSQRPLDLARALEGVGAVQMARGDRKMWRATQSQVSSIRRQFAPGAPSPQGPELVVGGDFEQGLQPPWGTGHYESGNFNFGIWWNSKTCESYAKTDSDVKHQGQSSLRVTSLTPTGAHLFGTTSQRVRAIKPNTLYEISVWAKADDLKPGAVQFVMDAGWHVRPLALPGGTHEWREFKAQFNSGDLNFVDVRILILNTGTVWLDQLSLRELAEEERPVDGLLAAETLFRKGKLLEALEAYGKLPPSSTTKSKTAQVLAALGRYGEALALYQQLNIDSSPVGLAIGDIYLKLGQPQKAAERFQAVYRAAPDDQFARAQAADRLAAAYLRMGDTSQAISWQGEALVVMTHINDPHGRAETLFHLARIHHRAGQFAQAEHRIKDSLPLALATGDRTLESDILTLRAVLSGERESYPEALEDLERAIQLKRQVVDRYGLLSSLYWQARYLEKTGQVEHAVHSLEEASSILDEVKEASAVIQGSEETLLQSHWRLYEDLVRLYLQLEQNEKALEALTRSRSAELNRVFQDKASTLQPQDQKLVQRAVVLRAENNALENRLKEQLSNPEDSRDPELVEETRQERERRLREYREFLSSLFKDHPELAGLISVHPKQLRLKQKGLKPGQAILEYLCGENQLYIFLVTPEELVVKVVDFPRVQIREQIRSLQADIFRMREESVKSQSYQLYEKLLAPVAPHLEGVKTLGILPNGPLHYLPFQLLVTDPQNTRYLVDDLACLNMCEESFLAPAKDGSALRKLLLLGNPDGTLRNAEMEVQEISKLFPGSEVYVRSQASKDKLYPAGQDYQGLHIATHGVFDKKDASRSYLTLAPKIEGLESRLTVGEIWGMDLEGFELVTLSACLTGWGEENPGDDLISLENAFLYAGARSVIASLWSVDDVATNLLMKRFYTGLREGKGQAESLREAQLEVKKSYPAPFYWAPFVVVGPN
jgi:CHAT domain-containing protein